MQKLLALVLALGFALPAGAETQCNLRFDVTANIAHGSIDAGNTMKGTIEFTSSEQMQQGSEAYSYFTNGTMRIEADDGSAITGTIGTVHVVRTDHTGDYISIDSPVIVGDLGGITSYVGPMLVTLYGNPNSLATFALPVSPEDWNLLDKRRVFQVHTPNTNATLPGKIRNLIGRCE